jgi:hypothetical protein
MSKAMGCLAAVILALVSPALAEDTDSPRVGKLGDPARLEILGAKSFSADQIRQALFNELQIAVAGDADAPLDALTKLLAEKATAGYQAAGFPDAKVLVEPCEGGLTATIEEGERFAIGDIEVVGNHTLDPARLVAELKPPADGTAPKKHRPWQPGKPAYFNSEANDWLTTEIASLAGDQGCYRTRLNVAVVPDRETKKATLRIEFSNEGPLTSAGEITFAGNDKNSSEALRAYLGLEAKPPLTRELREQVERRLLRSGRFDKVQWDLGKPGAREDGWQPCLKLEENALAPPLADALTREEQALVKLAEWIERFDESEEELLIRLPSEKVSVNFAPRRGFIVLYGASDQAGPDATPEFSGALVMAEDRVGLYSVQAGHKLEAAPPPSPLVGQAVLTLIGGAPSWDGRSILSMGAGVRRFSQPGYRRHITIQLRTTASAALSVVRKHEAKCDWEGDTARFEWNGRTLRVDAATGRLIEQVVHEPAPTEGRNAQGGGLSAQLTSKPGEFARRLAEIEKLSADWPNLADARRPLSCISEFVCGELKQLDAESRQGYAALHKMVSLGLLEPFDDQLRQFCEPGESGFSVPRPYWQVKFNDLAAALRTLIPVFGLRLGNFLLPREGWLNPVWQNGVFAFTRMPVRLSGELSGQHCDDRGPVCELLVAEAMRAAGMDLLAPNFARQGLRRLTPAAFRQDYAPLLSSQGFVSDYLLRFADVMRQLDANEVEALGKLLVRGGILNPDKAESFQQCLAALRACADDSPAEAAGKALDAAWTAGLSQWVESRLNALLPQKPNKPAFAALPGGQPGLLPPPSPTDYRYGPPTFAGPPSAAPAPASEGYGATPPDSAESYIPTATPEAEEQTYGAYPRPAKSLRQEITELRRSAYLLSERLAELEARLAESDVPLNAADAKPANVILGPPGGVIVGAPDPRQLAVHFSGPTGLSMNPETSPGRFSDVHFPFPWSSSQGGGSLQRYRLTRIPTHAGEHVYLTFFIPLLPDQLDALPKNNGTPVEINQAELDAAVSGTAVTKVLYLQNAEGETPSKPRIAEVTTTQFVPGIDPVAEAGRRGDVLAIIHIARELPTVLPRFDTPGDHTARASTR